MTRSTLILSTVAASFVALTASEARAEILEACGGVYLEALAEGSCEVVPVEQCETECQPTSTVKICAARLEVECSSECVATASVECEASCGESCVPECEASASEEEPPNCMGLCMSDCQMDCTAACEGVQDNGECRSGCAQCCADDCHAQCGEEEETTCEPVCGMACSGSCEARANVDCQIGCQSERFQECETVVTEECRTDCETSGAAIFCDGQFLAAADKLQPCAEELLAYFNVELDLNLDLDVDCEGDSCEGDLEGEGEGDAAVGCFSSVGRPGPGGLGWAVLLMLGIGGWRIRRAARR